MHLDSASPVKLHNRKAVHNQLRKYKNWIYWRWWTRNDNKAYDIFNNKFLFSWLLPTGKVYILPQISDNQPDSFIDEQKTESSRKCYWRIQCSRAAKSFIGSEYLSSFLQTGQFFTIDYQLLLQINMSLLLDSGKTALIRKTQEKPSLCCVASPVGQISTAQFWELVRKRQIISQ